MKSTAKHALLSLPGPQISLEFMIAAKSKIMHLMIKLHSSGNTQPTPSDTSNVPDTHISVGPLIKPHDS